MEKVKRPISVKIIFWITEIAFWLMTASFSFMVIGCIVVLLGWQPPDMNLHVKAPFTFTVESCGVIDSYKGDLPIRLVEQSGSMHFIDTPLFVTRYFAASIIIVMVVFFFIIFPFRNLIRNVYHGVYFDMKNVNYLRNI